MKYTEQQIRDNRNKVMRQIENHPETWSQKSCHAPCGNAHCLAGWAEVMFNKEHGIKRTLNHDVYTNKIALIFLGLEEISFGYGYSWNVFFSASNNLSDLQKIYEAPIVIRKFNPQDFAVN